MLVFFNFVFQNCILRRLQLLSAMCDVTSFTVLRSQTPARKSRKSTQFSRKHRRCSPAASLCVLLAVILKNKTMALHKDDLDFDWVANKEELEEVLCVLAGSDPENCSYSRVSRRRVPAASLRICSFPKEMSTNG